jgi:hypothetical protein
VFKCSINRSLEHWKDEEERAAIHVIVQVECRVNPAIGLLMQKYLSTFPVRRLLLAKADHRFFFHSV